MNPSHLETRRKTWCAHRIKIFLTAVVLILPVFPLRAQDFTTERNDNNRTGTSFNTGLNQAVFGRNSQWRRIAALSVTGNVLAQPLLLEQVQVPPGLNRDIVYVATELNNIYAFDANSQALLW